MGGLKLTAAGLALLVTTTLGSSSLVAQDTSAQVVTMKQPISVVGYTCECNSCVAGVPCGRPLAPPTIPEVLNYESLTPYAVSEPSCGAGIGTMCSDPGCDGRPSCGAANPSCGAASPNCGAASPSCGAANPTCGAAACDGNGCDCAGTPSCGAAEPTCGAGGQCDGCTCAPTSYVQADNCQSGCNKCGKHKKCSKCGSHGLKKHSLFGKFDHSHGKGCGGRKCKNKKCIDCCCLDLCKKQGFWIRADTLLWWTPDDDIPTLASTSPLGTPIDQAGVLGLPTTTPLFNGPLFGDMRVGGRIRFGRWADDCKHGFEGSVWGLLNERDERSYQSDGNPALTRPFTNADPLVPGPDSQLVGFDGVLSGRLTINSSSDIYGGDLGIRKNLLCCSDPCDCSSFRVDCYAGYRYFRVREGLRITENLESTSLVGPTALGTRIDLFDDFQTRNEFHGGVIGMVAQHQHQKWTAEVVSRLALGNINREVTIDGQTTVTVPTVPPLTRQGGLLAQQTNIGTFEDNEFAVLPEFQVNLGYNLTCHTKFMVGYTFLYLGDLVRPGDVIDPTVNGLQLDPSLPLAGPARPEFAPNDSETWLMGLSLGVELNF